MRLGRFVDSEAARPTAGRACPNIVFVFGRHELACWAGNSWVTNLEAVAEADLPPQQSKGLDLENDGAPKHRAATS